MLSIHPSGERTTVAVKIAPFRLEALSVGPENRHKDVHARGSVVVVYRHEAAAGVRRQLVQLRLQRRLEEHVRVRLLRGPELPELIKLVVVELVLQIGVVAASRGLRDVQKPEKTALPSCGNARV